MLYFMRRCGNGPFRVRLVRQLEKRCGNAAGRVPRKNPDRENGEFGNFAETQGKDREFGLLNL